MKKHLLCLLSIVMMITSYSKAETEPNNTYLQANTLAPNGNDGGTLTATTDIYDWWKVTTTVDGQLIVSTLCDPSLNIALVMYDINGTSFIAGNDLPLAGTNQSTHFNNLLPGTSYYIEVYNQNGGTGSYTITCVFNPAALPNDPIYNDSASVAFDLGINASSTGHIGYTDTGYYDLHDWWMVTIPQDGELIINTTSDTTAEIDLVIYDVDSVTQIAFYDTSFGIHEAVHHSHLMPGTYFIDCYLPTPSYGYGSYSIQSTFNPAGLTPDPLNNDTFASATTLNLATLQTGHLCYYTHGYTDRNDWYSVTVPLDGRLIVSTVSDTTGDIDLTMYDINGISQIAPYDTSFGINESTHHSLMPGTFFIHAYIPAASQYSPYTIYASFDTAALPNDAEPNDVTGNAIVLTNNVSQHGHLGYFRDSHTDSVDWYVINVSSSDSLLIETISDSTLELDFSFYSDTNLIIPITSGLASGPVERVIIPGPLQGNYYINARRFGGYGAYNIMTSRYSFTTIDELNAQAFVFFPNPVSKNIYWELKFGSPGNYEIFILNQSGEIVRRQVILETNGVLDLSEFSSGIYFIQIERNGKIIQRQKVSKI